MSIHHWKVPDQYKFEFEYEFLIHLDKLQYMRKILSIGYIRHLIFKIKVLGSQYIQKKKKRNILRKFRYLLLEARHLDKIQIQFRRYHRHGSNTIHCQQEVDYYIVWYDFVDLNLDHNLTIGPMYLRQCHFLTWRFVVQ